MEKARRGFNIALFAGKNHELISVKTYDTYGDKDASASMVEDFASIQVGTVIVAAVMDEGSRQLSQEAKDLFNDMGAKEINNLQFRQGYIFMGMKGAKNHIEKIGDSVNAGMILGYARVTKREKRTKTVIQEKSYKKTVRRVSRKTVKVTDSNGNVSTKIVTKVSKRNVTC